MLNRKPMPFGERAPFSKLTDKQVMEIRDSPEVSTRILAKKFGVNQSTVWRIRVHKKHKRNPEGAQIKKIKEDIIALAKRKNGRFTDRYLQTNFSLCLYQCLYALDSMIDDGIVEVCGRPPSDRKDKFFVYRLVSFSRYRKSARDPLL